MRFWLGIVLALYVGSADARPRGASILPRGDVICDITTGVATGVGAGTCVAHPATCNGTADDALAFADFLTWANLTWQASFSGLVEMYIPPGKSCTLKTQVVLTSSSFDSGCASPSTYAFPCNWSSNNIGKGINKFLLNFTSSSITASGGPIFDLSGADGVCHNGIATGAKGCSARTATVSTGATSVTLLDTSLCSRFTAGRWVVMTGFAVQALYSAASAFGYPPNFQFYDYAKIVSTASCAGSGVITLDRALTNDYKSTWPANAPGSVGEADQGGPATLYNLPIWWDTEAEYRGGTLDNGTQQTNDAARSLVFRDVTWGGSGNCTYPTQAIDWAVIGGNWSICAIEMDKIVVNASFQNTSITNLHHQSASPRYVTVNNSTLFSITGTPRNFTISNSSITQAGNNIIGVTSFGRSDYFSAVNVAMTGGLASGGATENGTVSAGVWSISGQSGGPYSATMTNGIITVPNTHGAVTWGVPGANLVFSFSSALNSAIYQVLDITQDATNQYVTTNCVGVNTACGVGGGFPVASGSFQISTHPSPKFNCTGGTGNVAWTSACGGPANTPLFSYQKYTADVTFPISSTNWVTTWGYPTSLVFTVNNPYAGAGTLSFNPFYQFGYKVFSQTGTTSTYSAAIDLKTGGTRTITGSGCTGCGGADSGTTLPFGALTWFPDKTIPNISSHPAWAGTIDITMTFDQGVVNPP